MSLSPAPSLVNSLEAQNGSVQPQSESFLYLDSSDNATYATQTEKSVGEDHNPMIGSSTHSNQDTRNFGPRNGYGSTDSYEKPYTNGHQQFLTTHSPFTQSEESDPYTYQHYHEDYLPTTSHPATPIYESEFVIDSNDEDRQALYHPASPLEHRGSWLQHQDATESQHSQRRSQTPTQRAPQTINVAGSPTARKWSREYSPEERLRLGLPRWESEQDRLAYERQQRQEQRRI